MVGLYLSALSLILRQTIIDDLPQITHFLAIINYVTPLEVRSQSFSEEIQRPEAKICETSNGVLSYKYADYNIHSGYPVFLNCDS
jgi:hypothetical protein